MAVPLGRQAADHCTLSIYGECDWGRFMPFIILLVHTGTDSDANPGKGSLGFGSGGAPPIAARSRLGAQVVLQALHLFLRQVLAPQGYE